MNRYTIKLTLALIFLCGLARGDTFSGLPPMPLSVANGGTGAASAGAARTALGAAASGANSDITSITALSTPLTAGQGGTGSSSLPAAGQILVGNGGGTAFAPQALAGDATITSGGTMTIAAGAVTGAKMASGTITDTQVNAAAGITWTKISKSGSSLADLATRNMSDLSGSVTAGQMPALTGDATSSAGAVATTVVQARGGAVTFSAGGLTAGSDFQPSTSALTAGTMTLTNSALSRRVISRFDWTNAMVTGLGAVTSGNVTVCTLPAKTVVTRVWVIITGQAAGPASLTMSVGRTGALYIDYVVASSAKSAVNTVFGASSADLGTNLTGYDLPSVTGTTAVVAQFVSVGANLSAVTGSSGTIEIETMTLP